MVEWSAWPWAVKSRSWSDKYCEKLDAEALRNADGTCAVNCCGLLVKDDWLIDCVGLKFDSDWLAGGCAGCKDDCDWIADDCEECKLACDWLTGCGCGRECCWMFCMCWARIEAISGGEWDLLTPSPATMSRPDMDRLPDMSSCWLLMLAIQSGVFVKLKQFWQMLSVNHTANLIQTIRSMWQGVWPN